jgi:hypothetical protein
LFLSIRDVLYRLIIRRIGNIFNAYR